MTAQTSIIKVKCLVVLSQVEILLPIGVHLLKNKGPKNIRLG